MHFDKDPTKLLSLESVLAFQTVMEFEDFRTVKSCWKLLTVCFCDSIEDHILKLHVNLCHDIILYIIPFILHAPWFIAGYLDLVIQPTVERAAPKGTIRVMSSLKFIVFRVQQFDSALAQTHIS